ncbi:MAG TPA: hypothetical protein VFV33_26410, partial [Gemmatimonadaceae bacterium]|nr:hypothetical protein [Gemmatimonadaceae bacterium]
MASPAGKARRRILVIDIGGTNIKVAGSWRRDPVKIESGPDLTPSKMANKVRALTADWSYDVISIG